MDPCPPPLDRAAAGARAARVLEAAAASASWLVLVWITRRPPCVEGCGGVLGGRALSLALVVATAWMAPGWMAARLLSLRGVSDVGRAAFAGGLGLAWLMVLAGAVLAAGRGLDDLVLGASVATGALTLAFVAWRLREPVAAAEVEPKEGARGPRLLAAAALITLVAVAASAPGFTYGSDEWFYLRVVRQFLDGKGWIHDFDAWELVLALLVRLAGLDLLEAYRVLLPPFLMAAAGLAFVALAEAVLRGSRAAAFAFVLHALYCLSDMHTRGTGAGMALLARIAEDKYVALLIAVPLAQAALVRFAAGGAPRLLALAAVLGLAGELVHPLAVVWIGMSAALPAGAWVWARRRRLRWTWVAAAAAAALALLATGVWLRSLRPAAYYQLSLDSAANARLFETLRRQVVVLSLERGWYMGDPRLLAHPLVLAALVGTVWLAGRARGSPQRLFLVGSMAVPLLLVFVPPLAMWVGSWISPWILPRVLWAMPVALVLAAVLQDRLGALENRLGRTAPTLPTSAAWAAALSLAALLLAPRMTASVKALDQRNRIYVSPGERELLDFVAAERRLSGVLLAPPGLSVRLPAWSSRVRSLPGPDALRSGLPPELAADCARLLEARSISDEQVALLDKHGITYVAARNGSPLGRKLARLAPAFAPRFRGSVYTLYEWRKERWPQVGAR